MSLPEGWVESTLGELVDIFNTKRVPISKQEREKIKGIYPYYGASNIFDYINDYIFDGEYLLISEDGENLNTRNTPIAFIVNGKFWVNNHAHIVKGKNQHISKYLAWYFSQLDISPFITGAVQPKLSKTNLLRIPIIISEDIKEQKAIANILSSFDEKIALLKAQNETLEQMAQGVFREWFVKFNYPNVTGKMVESELGVIPEGWRVDTIDNLVELIIDYRGKTPKKLGMDWSEKGIPALSAKTIKNGKIVRRDAMNLGSEELYHLWMKDELMPKDILLTSEAPLGEMYYLIDDKKYILSQRLFALRANDKISSEYLYYYLFSRQGQNLLNARASGSTVQGIRQSELRKVEVLIPDSKTLEKASALFERVFQKINLNENQIQTLQKTRDTLLPKLMSGDVRVKGFGA